MSDIFINYPVKKYKNGKWIETIDIVCNEVSYEIYINGNYYANLVCLPIDLKELVTGFFISEGIIDDIKLIKSMIIEKNKIKVSIEDGNFIENLNNNQIEIRTSGYIGPQNIRKKEFPMIKSDINIDQNLINIIFKSQKKLQDLAEIWRKTGGTHQAAVFKLSGDLVAFAEDCGRHNAMDKVIGKTYLQKINPNKCFLITTGRLSFGMVSKVIRAMFPLVVSNTAPLSGGIKLAKKVGLTLICFSRELKFNLYQ